MWSAGSRARQRGFTLVELIVVLGIVAMIVLLALPRLGGMAPGVALRATAEEMRTDIRRARNSALRESRETVILFDRAAGSWADGEGRILGQLPDGAELEAVVARSERRDETTGGVRFHPDGTATGATLTLSDGAHRVRVSVDWFDGQVTTGEVTTGQPDG